MWLVHSEKTGSINQVSAASSYPMDFNQLSGTTGFERRLKLPASLDQ